MACKTEICEEPNTENDERGENDLTNAWPEYRLSIATIQEEFEHQLSVVRSIFRRLQFHASRKVKYGVPSGKTMRIGPP